MAAAPLNSPANVRFRLRDATASAHRKVEAAMALADRCVDLASYRTLLTDLWGLYAPLEAGLAALPWDDIDFDVKHSAKMPWLRADLRALGLSERDIAALPRALKLPSMRCSADAFGVLYVLEGASLGGQIILRQIKLSLGVTEGSGGRFFGSYGADVGERWRSFVAVIERYGNTECRVQAMQRAALATFDCFLLWIDECAWRSDEGAYHVP